MADTGILAEHGLSREQTSGYDDRMRTTVTLADDVFAIETVDGASDWLASEVAWIPARGPRHHEVLGDLLTRDQICGNPAPDAQLAALALEHGLVVYSADSDFACFGDVRWENPVAG